MVKITCRNIFKDIDTNEYVCKVKGKLLKHKNKVELKRLIKDFDENYPKYATEYEGIEITKQLDKQKDK